jgi:hypothetical protein
MKRRQQMVWSIRGRTEVDRPVEQLSRSEIDAVIPLRGVAREFNGCGRCVNCR